MQIRIPLLAFVLIASFAHAADRPPNVLLINCDDLGYNDLSCYGAPLIKTPRLDKVAAEGMRFTSFYSAAPVCTPSRAALMTGCYPQRVSMAVAPRAPGQKANSDRVWYPNSPYGLNRDEITIAELLKSRGYATSMVGKWHLGDHAEFLPTSHGFDEYFGIPYSNDMAPVVYVRGTEIVERDVKQAEITDRYTDEAAKFIRAHAEGPFFLYLAHNMPHTPLFVADRHKDRSKGGLYGDVVEALDESTGKLLDVLTELGIDRDTLVIFTSDNGPWHIRGEHGGSATPLRAGKGTTYEGGMRVPCIMRWPAAIPPGTTCDEMAAQFDLLPTLAKLAGGEPPTDRAIDGKDIAPLMRAAAGAASPHEAFFYYSGGELNAVRSGPWKLKFVTRLQEETEYGKYEQPDAPIPERLYNLATDPGEQKSLLRDHPEIAKRLRKLADDARQDLGDARTDARGRNVRPFGRASGAPDPEPSNKAR